MTVHKFWNCSICVTLRAFVKCFVLKFHSNWPSDVTAVCENQCGFCTFVFFVDCILIGAISLPEIFLFNVTCHESEKQILALSSIRDVTLPVATWWQCLRKRHSSLLAVRLKPDSGLGAGVGGPYHPPCALQGRAAVSRGRRNPKTLGQGIAVVGGEDGVRGISSYFLKILITF